MAKKKHIKYFNVLDDNRNCSVNFSKLIGERYKNAEHFNISISIKKVYSKLIEYIVEENNNILNMNHTVALDFIKKYVLLKNEIDTKAITGETAFIQSIVGHLFDVSFMGIIDDYVEKHYCLTIDLDVAKNREKYPDATTFTDAHYKVMYRIAIMSRLIIPLATHYIKLNPEINGTQFLMRLSYELFTLTHKRYNVQVYNKLYIYIQKAIKKTLYTDKGGWENVNILGVSPEQFSMYLMEILTVNIMPKLNFTGDIMKFVTVVLRDNIINYNLRTKFPYSIKCLNDLDIGNKVEDDAIIKDSELFDSYNIKHDETYVILREIYMDDTINKIANRMNIVIDPVELKWYTNPDNLHIHSIQTIFILNVFDEYFKGVDQIYALDEERYAKLMLILVKFLETIGLHKLIKYITGAKEGHSIRRVNKNLLVSLENDPRYINLVSNKYAFAKGYLEKNNFIKDTILELINNIYKYNIYNDSRNGTLIENNDVEIMNSVLEFFHTVII